MLIIVSTPNDGSLCSNRYQSCSMTWNPFLRMFVLATARMDCSLAGWYGNGNQVALYTISKLILNENDLDYDCMQITIWNSASSMFAHDLPLMHIELNRQSSSQDIETFNQSDSKSESNRLKAIDHRAWFGHKLEWTRWSECPRVGWPKSKWMDGWMDGVNNQFATNQEEENQSHLFHWQSKQNKSNKIT